MNIGQKLFAINRKYVLFDCFIVLVVVLSFFHNAPIENGQARKSLFYQTPRDFLNPLDVIYAHPFYAQPSLYGRAFFCLKTLVGLECPD